MRLHLIEGCCVKKHLGTSLLWLSVSLRLEVIKKPAWHPITAPEVSQQLTPKDKICNWKMGPFHLFQLKKYIFADNLGQRGDKNKSRYLHNKCQVMLE